jgi:hypothetical protein
MGVGSLMPLTMHARRGQGAGWRARSYARTDLATGRDLKGGQSTPSRRGLGTRSHARQLRANHADQRASSNPLSLPSRRRRMPAWHQRARAWASRANAMWALMQRGEVYRRRRRSDIIRKDGLHRRQFFAAHAWKLHLQFETKMEQSRAALRHKIVFILAPAVRRVAFVAASRHV